MHISEPNEHIEEYLDYYFDGKKNFEYAVLLNGAWGSGKTWFVKKYLEKKEDGKRKICYVSLNGIAKTSMIDEAIFKSIHPILGSKGAKLVGQLGKGLLKATLKVDLDGDSKPDLSINASLPSLKLPDYLTIDDNFILVFDDLERCELKKEEVLGYINYFVEQEGIKTLIVSNEEEIKDNDEYARKKEKLIGATFSYIEDQNLAIKSILDEILEVDLKSILNSEIELIAQTFNQVGYKNLRAFKQTIFDFERLYKRKYFEDKDDSFDSEIFKKVLRAFLIISLENKKGRFKGEVLKFKPDDKEPTTDEEKHTRAFQNLVSFVGEDAQIFYKKYQMKLNEYIFSKELWNQILNKNIINDSLINEELYQTYFRFKEESPTWFKLWHYLDLEQKEFEELVKEAKLSIEHQSLTNVTDILHTVSMLVYFKEKSLIFFSIESLLVLAISQYKKTVNLQENIKNFGYFDIRDESGGYGLYAKELPIFQKFLKDIAQAYEDKYIEKNEERGKVLLTLMENDSYEFYQQITNKFHDYPILNVLEPQDFLNQLFKINYRCAMSAIDGLKSRYTVHSQAKIYLQEENWFERVIEVTNEKLAQPITILEKHKLQGEFLPNLAEIKNTAYKG